MSNEKSPTQVVAGPVRFSYPHVFEKMAPPTGEGKAKYSACLLIPKTNTALVDKIKAAIAAAKKAKWGEKIPKTLKEPLRDGDEKDDEAYEGMYFLNCNTDNKPTVLDADRNLIMEKDDFYAGCYGYASVNFFGYDLKGVPPGVSCGLNHVMKTKEGERLSSKTSAEDDFGDIEIYNDDL